MSAAVLSRSTPIGRGTGADVDDEAVGVCPPQPSTLPRGRSASRRPAARRRLRPRTGPRGARYQQRRPPVAAGVQLDRRPAIEPVRPADAALQQWRLTARGRALLNGLTVSTTLVVAGLVLAAGMFTLVRTVSGPTPQDARVVIVEPGQSLWQIAGERSVGGNQADMVARIRALNHLGDTTLQPGQRLLVPAGE
jgi:hypothetical protein